MYTNGRLEWHKDGKLYRETTSRSTDQV
jgi:hypothetical protein